MLTHQTAVGARGNGHTINNGLDGHDAEHKDDARHVNGGPAPAAVPAKRRATRGEILDVKIGLWKLIRADYETTLRSTYAAAALRLLIQKYVPATEVLRIERIAKGEVRNLIGRAAVRRGR
jgi:hypothetical protein